MFTSLRKTISIGLPIIGLSLLASSAQAFPYLPGLTNLDFTQYTGTAPKAPFTSVNPVGWSGGNGLIFIASNVFAQSAAGPVYLTTYGNPGILSGPAYNYVEADGNPSFESSFNHQLTGLTPGQTYTLSFYQGASQQTGFANGQYTTEQWIVSLGTSAMAYCNGCGAADAYYGGYDSTYSNADPFASVVATSPMTTPSGGTTPWQLVSVDLTAHAATELLSFLAWGNNGNTVNLPPMVFLTQVDTPDLVLVPVPEPETLALFAVGLLGFAASRLRKPAKLTA